MSSRLPYELVRCILLVVLADTVHAISISDTDVSWETDAFSTLSSVSFVFRAIVIDTATQAFNIQEGESVIRVVRVKLGLLRKAGLDIRQWCRQLLPSIGEGASPMTSLASDLRTIVKQGNSIFVTAYLIWIFSQRFRRVTMGDSSQDQTRALRLHEEFLQLQTELLLLNTQACISLECIRPVEMKIRIAEALELDRILISIGMDMIRARIDLVEAERRLKFLETQPEYTMDSIQQLIDKGLCLIENANLFGDEPDNASKHLMDQIFLYRQLNPLMLLLKGFLDVELESDLYNITSRVQALHSIHTSWACRSRSTWNSC